jgi:hypothetical protein
VAGGGGGWTHRQPAHLQAADGGAAGGGGLLEGMSGMMRDLAGAIPGIDEAMSFSELMNRVKVSAAASGWGADCAWYAPPSSLSLPPHRAAVSCWTLT